MFYGAYKYFALLALTLIATTPSLADMQPIDGFAIDQTEVTVG